MTKKYSNYQVTITAKFPAAGERPGEIEVLATSAAEATRYARDFMRNAGHTRQDGPLFFKATKTEAFRVTKIVENSSCV